MKGETSSGLKFFFSVKALKALSKPERADTSDNISRLLLTPLCLSLLSKSNNLPNHFKETLEEITRGNATARVAEPGKAEASSSYTGPASGIIATRVQIPPLAYRKR